MSGFQVGDRVIVTRDIKRHYGGYNGLGDVTIPAGSVGTVFYKSVSNLPINVMEDLNCQYVAIDGDRGVSLYDGKGNVEWSIGRGHLIPASALERYVDLDLSGFDPFAI